MNKLVKLIAGKIKAYPKPCVNISGGIDSTIILHHVCEVCEKPIYTYTIGFPNQPNEFAPARAVAEHYNTIHREIQIRNMLQTYRLILPHMDRPRFNLWKYWAAKQAYEDARKTCYIGEGGDEHFGGYWYKPRKSYVENWCNFFMWGYPSYQQVYDHFAIRLEAPLHPDNLSWQLTLPYYDNAQEKRHLRKAYKEVLPDFVVNRSKLNGRFSYYVMWDEELQSHFPNENPKTEDEIRDLLNVWVTKEWLKSHSKEESSLLSPVLARKN